MLLYYIPGQMARVNQVLDANALRNRFETGPTFPSQWMPGPDGGHGYIFADGSVPAIELRYDKDKQTWVKFGEYWIGYRDRETVTPKSLERKEPLGGHAVKLGDDQLWTIPCGVYYAGTGAGWGINLPTTFHLDENRQWVQGQVKKRYAPLWEITQRIHAAWISRIANAAAKEGEKLEIEIQTTLAEEFDMLSLALSYNYRVTADEVSLLGLCDQASINAAMMAIIDEPTLLEHAKKNGLLES